MVDYEAKQIGEVKGLGLIYQVRAPLDKQILSLIKVGAEMVSPEETAMIRIAEVSNDYTRTSMAPVAVKGEKPVLYKASPFMNPAMAKIAVNAHSNGKYPSFNREFYEVVKEIANTESSFEPEDRTAQILDSSEDYDLTPEMDDAKFILGKNTSEYFKKFGHSKINFLNLPVGGLPKDKCNVNYLWFNRPENGSSINGRDRSLNNVNRAFGVRKSAEGAAKNSGYALTDIKNAIITAMPKSLEELGLSGLENLKTTITGKLESSILGILRKQ